MYKSVHNNSWGEPKRVPHTSLIREIAIESEIDMVKIVTTLTLNVASDA